MFFDGVIHYYEQKVQWFDNAIFPAIDWNLDEDVNFVEETVYPEQNRIWELLDSIRSQLYNVNEQIQNLEFDQFLFNFNMAEIDSAWFEGDIARQKKWIDDTYSHMASLDGKMNELWQTDPDDETISYLPVESETLYDQYSSEWNDVRGYTDELERVYNEVLAHKAREDAAALALDEQRKANAAAEAARQQAEDEARQIDDRKRNMEHADHEIKEATKQITQTDKDLNAERDYVTTLTKGPDNEEI